MCDFLSHDPHQGPGLQPRHVPWLGIKPGTLWFAGWCSIHWATPARAWCSMILIRVKRKFYSINLAVKCTFKSVSCFNNNSNLQCHKVSCVLSWDSKRHGSFPKYAIHLLLKNGKILKISIQKPTLGNISVIIFISSHFMHILTLLRTQYPYNFVIYLIHSTLIFSEIMKDSLHTSFYLTWMF